jgi:hypothetical protein
LNWPIPGIFIYFNTIPAFLKTIFLNWSSPGIPICFNTIPAFLKTIFLNWSIPGMPICLNTIPACLKNIFLYWSIFGIPIFSIRSRLFWLNWLTTCVYLFLLHISTLDAQYTTTSIAITCTYNMKKKTDFVCVTFWGQLIYAFVCEKNTLFLKILYHYYKSNLFRNLYKIFQIIIKIIMIKIIIMIIMIIHRE